MLGKKSQIGDTMTWIVATLIIFFIMAVYVAAVAALTSRGGLEDYRVSYVNHLALADELTAILDMPFENVETGKESTIYQGIVDWANYKDVAGLYETIQQILESKVKEGEYSYYLNINYAYETDPHSVTSNPIRIQNMYEKDILDFALIFYIYANDEKLRIIFYRGDVPDEDE